MIRQTKKKPSYEDSAISKSVHLPSANNPYFTTLIDWYVSTSLSEQQQSELEDLLNKHGDKIGLTPDVRYLDGLDQENFRLLKRIDESYEHETH
jgi:hypothetical protein